jgi:hypothetical protein
VHQNRGRNRIIAKRAKKEKRASTRTETENRASESRKSENCYCSELSFGRIQSHRSAAETLDGRGTYAVMRESHGLEGVRLKGAASARTSDPGATVGRLCGR